MKLQIICNNAYRILGVPTTASKKDIERNKSRFNAFLRVKRSVPPQPFDFTKLLGDIDRNLETISTAESEISIPAGQRAHEMFWFVRMSSLDDECFQEMASGNIKGAIDKWKADGSVSSLQNLLVCMLIEGYYKEAVLLANNLYTVHLDKWKEMYSFMADVNTTDVSSLFLDRLFIEIPKEISSMNWDSLSGEWESYVKQKNILPIVNKITVIVEECHNSNCDNSKSRYKDGLSMLAKAGPLLKELELLLKPGDITLVSMEDKVYMEALNCSIASYNDVYGRLNHGDDAPYREIAPECHKLVNLLSCEFVSPTVSKRIEDNKKIINETCSNIEKTIEEHLAFNDHICWFCGKYGDTEEYNKSYSYSVSTPTFGGTRTTTYTKTVKFFICDECKKELDEQTNWKRYSTGAMFIVLTLLFLIAFDIWMDFNFWGWVISIGIIGVLSHFGGKLTGIWVRKKLDKKNIREFKRNIDDHPLVKMVKADGYS